MDLLQYLSQSNFLILYVSILILITIGYLLFTILRKEQEFQDKEQQTITDYKKVLKSADAQARSMLERAADTSVTMMTDAKQTNEKITEELDRALQEIAAKELTTAKTLSEQSRKSYEEYLTTIATQMRSEQSKLHSLTEERLDQIFQEFSAALKLSSQTIEQSLDKRMQELFVKTQQEIDEYKKLQMENVAKQVYAMVEKTYEKVLRRTIPETVHHDLILQAFEEAKSDSIFNL